MASRPLPTLDSGAFRLASDCRSPPGLLNPSGSKRTARFHPEKLTIASRPICSRSPPRGNNKLLLRDGSTLQLRYFPLGSLSSEPLGTNASMRLKRIGVKGKNGISARNIWPVIKVLEDGAGGRRVNKTELMVTVSADFMENLP